MRRIWKVVLVLAPFAAVVYILGAVLTALVPDPVGAFLSHLGQVSTEWPFAYIPKTVSWWVFAALLIVVIVYIWFRIVEANHDRSRPLDGQQSTGLGETTGFVRASTARMFVSAILEPQERFSRITESVEPYTRSLNVRTTLTVRLLDAPVGERVIVPVMLSARGRLENRLSFTDEHGARISSLNVSSTNDFICEAVRALVRRSGPIVWVAFHRSRAAHESLDSRVRRYVTQATSDGNSPPSQDTATALIEDILALPRTPFDNSVLDIAALMWELRLDYPICISLVRSSTAVTTARITIERRVIPEVRSRRSSSPDLSSSAPARLRRSRRAENALERIGSAALDWLRQVAGVTSSVISHDLDNAARAASYHLEVRGPTGYYAARQRIIDNLGLPIPSAGAIEATSVQHAALRGQRHTHLYLRGASGARWSSFQAVFHERTPGSMAVALAASFAALVVASVLAVTQVRSAYEACAQSAADSGALVSTCLSTSAAATGSSDTLLQILLTFPLAILAMPLVRSSSVWGGVLIARMTNIAVIALTLIALALSALTSAFTPVGLGVAWILVLGPMLVVFLGALISWIQRTMVHASYVRAGDS